MSEDDNSVSDRRERHTTRRQQRADRTTQAMVMNTAASNSDEASCARSAPSPAAAGWLSSFLTRRSGASTHPAPPAPVPPPATTVNHASSSAPSRLDRVTQRWRSIRDSVESQIAHPHADSHAAGMPWINTQPVAGSHNTPTHSSGTDAGNASAASSLPPPPASAAGVSITTLNLYSDLSEVSGLLLCPGFERARTSLACGRCNDPVPSRVHPESISPTLLPPLPTIEARRAAQASANAQNARDEAEAAREPSVHTAAGTDVSHKLSEGEHVTTHTSPAVQATAGAESSHNPSALPSPNHPTLPPNPAPSVAAPPLLSRPPRSWLYSLFRRSAPPSWSTTLDFISGSSQPAATEPPAPMGDKDVDIDVRAVDTSRDEAIASARAHKRTNSLMQQLWLFGDVQSTSTKAAERKANQAKNDAHTEAATDATPAAAAVPDAQPAPSTTSRIGAILRSSASAVASAASSAAFWTLGPFEPYVPPAAPPETIDEPVEATPAPPPPPPPPPPPIWQTMRKVVIIGVHGWSLMGGMLSDRPIVVSNKFCQMAQRALATFCADHGVDLDRIQVCTIPLHGHGKVEHRVEVYLQQQLTSFKPYITTADAIFVVGHSQGVIVSVSVLHQLILQGWIDPTRQHVSMQLMAGLHHGPFPDLLWDLYAATKELFAYCYVESEVHRRYMQAIHYLLENSVKILCIGSVHDQAVPLYSSLLQSFPSSPNLLRGIYIDYSTYQPEFPYALLSLVIYLMNTGAHGVRRVAGANSNATDAADADDAAANVYVEALVHISGFLRGSLLENNGGAHSAIHRLTDCYNLGIEWSMSGRGVRTPVHVHSHSFSSWAPYLQANFTNTRMNRYMMVMRFRELFSRLNDTKLDGYEELRRLHYLYTSWQPRTKQLRQLKDAFVPLFDARPSIGVDPHDPEEENAPADDSAAPPAATPTAANTQPAPSTAALTSLLRPARLPILPAVLPASWQIRENARIGASAAAEPLSDQQEATQRTDTADTAPDSNTARDTPQEAAQSNHPPPTTLIAKL